ncbi:MAG: sialidase family protein [Candidatus Borkfalkiaceae bacterium]|nr:sialidase family protein [Clostridia bacterium]MDY6222561.1 sialidase family protein [Christensenellaceae bacterium]
MVIKVFISLVHMDTQSVEATVRRAPNGDLIVICTCGGVKEPAPENRVYLFRSSDEGKTWSEKQMIHQEDGFAHYQTCTVVENGTIYVFITRHNGYFVDWKNYVLVSTDSGFCWEEHPSPLLAENGFIRDMITLESGKKLFPYHAYPLTKEQHEYCRLRNLLICSCRPPIQYVDNGVYIGDFKDGFEKITAFRQTELPRAADGSRAWNWSENTVVELEKQHLVMLYRIENTGFLWRTDSFDGGKTWERPNQTEIPNPANKPQLLKGLNGEIILLNTPNNKKDFYLRRRFPLEAWVSYDDMNTWNKKIRISDFPGCYSYADGFIDSDGKLRLAFEFNRHDIYFAETEL